MKPEDKTEKVKLVMSNLPRLSDGTLIALGDNIAEIIERWLGRLKQVQRELERRKSNDERREDREAADGAEH
jgi:hypothetical protein